VQSELEVTLNTFFWNKAIGPETSLVHVKDLKKVTVQSNSVEWSGHVSNAVFAPPTLAFTPQERVTSSESLNLRYAQEYGQFYFDFVDEIQV